MVALGAFVLASLGRTHDRANVEARGRAEFRAIRVAASFNLDLIYGGAGESLEDWCATVDDAVASTRPTSRRTPSRWRRVRRSRPIRRATSTTTTRPTSTAATEAIRN